MRYWKVQVKPGNGEPFWCRAVEMSEEQVVLHSEHALPAGIECSMRINVPARESAMVQAGFSGKVEQVVFSSRGIELSLRVKWLSDDARRLIGKAKAQRAGVGK